MKVVIKTLVVAGIIVGSFSAGSVIALSAKPEVPTRTEVPQECIDAIKYGDDLRKYAAKGFQYNAEAMQGMVDGMQAVSVYDAVGIQNGTHKIEVANNKMRKLQPNVELASIRFQTHAALCQSMIDG